MATTLLVRTQTNRKLSLTHLNESTSEPRLDHEPGTPEPEMLVLAVAAAQIQALLLSVEAINIQAQRQAIYRQA